MVALNKVDIPDAHDLAELVRADVEQRGWPVFEISTKSGEGLQKLIFACAELVAERRANAPAPEPPRIVLRPEPVGGGPEFTIKREGELWRVRGAKPERRVRQTDFKNDEAVGYLADRLNRIGIETRLLELGALPGDGVAIGGEDAVIFDFAPQVDVGAEILSRRGEDQRLNNDRPAAQRRRAKDEEYHRAMQAGELHPYAMPTGFDDDQTVRDAGDGDDNEG